MRKIATVSCGLQHVAVHSAPFAADFKVEQTQLNALLSESTGAALTAADRSSTKEDTLITAQRSRWGRITFTEWALRGRPWNVDAMNLCNGKMAMSKKMKELERLVQHRRMTVAEVTTQGYRLFVSPRDQLLSWIAQMRERGVRTSTTNKTFVATEIDGDREFFSRETLCVTDVRPALIFTDSAKMPLSDFIRFHPFPSRHAAFNLVQWLKQRVVDEGQVVPFRFTVNNIVCWKDGTLDRSAKICVLPTDRPAATVRENIEDVKAVLTTVIEALLKYICKKWLIKETSRLTTVPTSTPPQLESSSNRNGSPPNGDGNALSVDRIVQMLDARTGFQRRVDRAAAACFGIQSTEYFIVDNIRRLERLRDFLALADTASWTNTSYAASLTKASELAARMKSNAAVSKLRLSVPIFLAIQIVGLAHAIYIF